MLRRLLRDDDAERAFLEKLDIFQQNPGLLGKYLIASEVSLAVLDLFLSRLFGIEGLSGVADAKEAVEAVMNPPSVEEKSGDEHWAVVEELKQQVLALTRQVSELQQQQLQMQGEVSQVATSLEDRLDEVTSACERRIAETEVALRDEIRQVDVSSRLSDVESDIEELQRERPEDSQRLEDDVSRLKEAEQALREEMETKIKRLDMRVAPLVDPLDGIIARLTRKCGGNVNDIVKVTASSCLGGGQRPENARDLGTKSAFCSHDLPDSWICYDFGWRRVTPTSYSIRSYDEKAGSYHPKSWTLEVSSDGEKWSIVDRRENNEDLNFPYVARNFALSAHPTEKFRFVRLRQTGKNHSGNDCLCISALELFGELF